MARVLERLTTPKAPIDMVRRHGAEEFHGSNMEESNKVEFWLEKLQRIVKEVRCPLDQRVTCVVSPLQGSAYDWWKLVLRSPRLPCDAPKPGGPLTTRQPVEYSWMSGYPTPLTKIGQSLLCTGSSTQGTTCPNNQQ